MVSANEALPPAHLRNARGFREEVKNDLCRLDVKWRHCTAAERIVNKNCGKDRDL